MKLQHLIFLRFNNIFSTNLFRIQQITITTTRFIQNVRLLHPCRPSVASESCPRSWSKFPRWFRSMPSSKLASRIPHSGGVSHTLFLLECSTQSNPEGSNLVSLAAIHRRCCANGYRPIWNQGNSHEWNFGSRLLCVLGPRPVEKSTHRR